MGYPFKPQNEISGGYMSFSRTVSLDQTFRIEEGEIGGFAVVLGFDGNADPNKSASYTSNENGGLSFKLEQA